MNSCQNQELIFHSLVVLPTPDSKSIALKQFNDASKSRPPAREEVVNDANNGNGMAC
jgi:hypothetical protein